MEVEVKEKQTTTIDVPAAGIIDLTCKTLMVGQIFVLNEGNNYDWVCNLTKIKQTKVIYSQVNTNLFTEEQNNFLLNTTEKIFTIKSNNTIYLTL